MLVCVTAAGNDEARDLRTELLLAAEAEVIEHGAARVSLRAIARRVGVSHQAPGHFFGNRTGLFTALATHELARMRAQLEATAADAIDLPARDRLSRLGVSYIHFARDNHALFSLALRPDLLDAQNEKLVAERVGAWTALVTAVADSQDDGWRAGEPLENVALLCWTVVHGTAIAWVDGLLTLQFPHLSLDEIALKVTSQL